MNCVRCGKAFFPAETPSDYCPGCLEAGTVLGQVKKVAAMVAKRTGSELLSVKTTRHGFEIKWLTAEHLGVGCGILEQQASDLVELGITLTYWFYQSLHMFEMAERDEI